MAVQIAVRTLQSKACESLIVLETLSKRLAALVVDSKPVCVQPDGRLAERVTPCRARESNVACNPCQPRRQRDDSRKWPWGSGAYVTNRCS
eukprot:6183998-Pleurochrysis_carterae.AAC.5